ncbi:Nse1 non-SMC component of SMC5-6 complex-domain-containing protein [Mycena maculata]|uniref:Non-structural maintenance of chromosomes element 1 homolog n=1 Tax=Mycena maculata TaxID=230809 RepID=A0AAD7IFL3_9AGAR|nr:Nse1 non-SMC component of SMC5-6 complex-domain-containing protein [Mycena maculata]
MAAVSVKDVQRLFLQAVLSRGVLSLKLAQTLWVKSKVAVMAADNNLEIAHAGTRDEWDAFVKRLNESLDNLDLEFKQFQEETTGRDMYAIVNRKDDAIAQMATDYTAGEIAFFKAMVEQIMLAPHRSFSITSLAALREVSHLKPKSNMSKTQAEVVLASFVAQGWLMKSKRGRYSLSTRALLELMPYLKSTYPDEIATECIICFEVVTKGVICPAAKCQVCMHYHCFSKYIRTRRRECPTCNTEWPGDQERMNPIGEGAARDGDDGRRRVRKTTENEEGDDMDEDEDEDEDGPPPPRTQQSRKGKGKKPAEDSMEVDEDGDEAEEEDSDTPVKTQGKRRASRRS